MASPGNDRDELLDLFDALLNDDISAADAEYVKTRLRDDEAARLLYIEYVDLHSELLCILAPNGSPEDLLASASAQRPFRWTLLVASLAAAAVFLIAVATGWQLWRREAPPAGLPGLAGDGVRPQAAPGEPPPPAIARIVSEADADWIDSPVAADEGVALYPGDSIHLGDGSAELEFTSGVRCIVSGTTALVLHSPQACTVEYGTAVFRVPEAGRGFRVSTLGGEIVDLGTSFGISCASDGRSEVHVFEGTVQAAVPGPGGNVLTLSQGRAGLLDPALDRVLATAFSAEKFRRPLSVAAGLRHLSPRVQFLHAPPASLKPRALNTQDRAILFVERTGVLLSKDLWLHYQHKSAVVRHENGDAPHLESSRVPAGTRVDSFLLQYGNERADVPQSGVSGKITFREPILGVIVDSEQLEATCGLLGHSRTEYPYDLRGTGLEHDDRHPDRLVISSDRRSIEFSLSTTGGYLDQVRILLKHPAGGQP